jgi:hypothetical protein
MDGDRVLYVSLVANDGKSQDVATKIGEIQMMHLKQIIFLDLDIIIKLKGKMLYVWEGNHKLTTWRRRIQKSHDDEKDWHISIDSICLDPTGIIDVLYDAMHNINQ